MRWRYPSRVFYFNFAPSGEGGAAQNVFSASPWGLCAQSVEFLRNTLAIRGSTAPTLQSFCYGLCIYPLGGCPKTKGKEQRIWRSIMRMILPARCPVRAARNPWKLGLQIRRHHGEMRRKRPLQEPGRCLQFRIVLYLLMGLLQKAAIQSSFGAARRVPEAREALGNERDCVRS